MSISDIDKVVCATLAAAKAAADKKELPGQYILEYEKMAKAFERRGVTKRDSGPAGKVPPSSGTPTGEPPK